MLRHVATCLAALLLLIPGAIPLRGQAPAPYRILVTNDDGIRAPGLAALVEALAPLGELSIVAPSTNHSGTGHALNLSDPIYVERVEVAGRAATGLTATPATCVRVALASLLTDTPDLVVSGVNRGSNFGLNAYISGTVAAAREAAMHGIPAIAASLDISGHPEYGAAAAATAQVAAIVKSGGLPRGVFLNVNVPPAPAQGPQAHAPEPGDGHRTVRGVEDAVRPADVLEFLRAADLGRARQRRSRRARRLRRRDAARGLRVQRVGFRGAEGSGFGSR